MNIYTLTYKFNQFDTDYGVLIFTNRNEAKEMARYYRDTLFCFHVSLRHDKSTHIGWCDIIGFIDF